MPSVRARPFPRHAQVDSTSIQQSLRLALKRHWGLVRGLFDAMDTDGDGTVSRAEFLAAMKSLGLAAPDQAIDGVFTSFDLDNSGGCHMRVVAI